LAERIWRVIAVTASNAANWLLPAKIPFQKDSF